MEPGMFVRKKRLEKGWSQEHLAQLSGLSVRTIQRIENGNKVGLESGKCLAAVFETDVSNLIQEEPMTPFQNNATDAPIDEYAANRKGFMLHIVTFMIMIPALYYFNLQMTPDYFWVKWVALFWGVGIVLHAATMVVMFRRSDDR